MGGIEDVLSDIRELIEEPLQNPEVRLTPVAAPAQALALGRRTVLRWDGCT